MSGSRNPLQALMCLHCAKELPCKEKASDKVQAVWRESLPEGAVWHMQMPHRRLERRLRLRQQVWGAR